MQKKVLSYTDTKTKEHSLKKKKNYVHIKRDQLVHAQHICCIQLDYMILYQKLADFHQESENIK